MKNGMKILRERARLTQEGAAARFGLSKGGYTKIEQGKRPLNAAYIKTAMAVFGASTEAEVLHEEAAKLSGAQRKLNAALRSESEALRRQGMAEFVAELADGQGALDWLEIVEDVEAAFQLPPNDDEKPDFDKIRDRARTLADQAKRKLQRYKEKKA